MTQPVIIRTCEHCHESFFRHFKSQHYCTPHCQFLSNLPQSSVNDSECWDWTGGIASTGYGRFCFDMFSYYAHRFSYAYFNKIPYGHINQVNHHCDNPKCVNPLHLYSGTQTQNMQDMAKRERSGTAKLNSEKVKTIRSLLRKTNLTAKRIGSIFNVSHETIYDIKYHRYWKHVA